MADGRRVRRWRSVALTLLALPFALMGLAAMWNWFVAPLLPQPPAVRLASDAGLDQMLEQVRAAMDAPAIAVRIVGPDGVRRAEAGVRFAGGPPVSPDDRWHLGSNGKAFVAALAARLVERGRARWGATVPELFPGLKVHPAWSAVTMEDLLSHRAGVDDSLLRFRLAAFHADPRSPAVQRRALAEEILARPPAGAPGVFAYSNLGYMLAGEAIAEIVGRPFEAAMADEFFAPLGLASAGFGAPKGAQPRGHGARWFGVLPRFSADPEGLSDNPAILSAAGRIHMSMDDWAKATAIVRDGGGGYLGPDSVAKLLSPPPEGERYALGWGVGDLGGEPVYRHAGSNTMWYSLALVAPGRRTAVFVAVNAGGDAVKRRIEPFARTLLARALGQPDPED